MATAWDSTTQMVFTFRDHLPPPLNPNVRSPPTPTRFESQSPRKPSLSLLHLLTLKPCADFCGPIFEPMANSPLIPAAL